MHQQLTSPPISTTTESDQDSCDAFRTPQVLDQNLRSFPPQSKINARRSRWGLWMLIVGVSLSGWWYQASWIPFVKKLLPTPAKSAVKPTPRPISVVALAASKRDLPVYLNGLGTVTAYKTVTIRSRVEGELIKVAFEEGQMVEEGELLAEIDPRPFNVQLAQAEGQLTRDEATLRGAQLTLDRYKSLLPSKTVTPQQVDEQEALVRQSEGTIQTDQGLVENARLQLTYCRIVAPIQGRIGLRLVDKGNIVRESDPNGLAVITQLEPISLVFPIPQDEISRVQKRMSDTGDIEVQAYDRTLKTRLATGKLQAIDNQVDPTTGTLKLKAVFKNEDQALFPNQFVNARLLVDTIRDAVIVPTTAIQRGPSNSFVYVLRSDETVELRNVEPGPSEGNETSIRKGLEAGEQVVTEGLDKLQPGVKVNSRAQQSEEGREKSHQKPDGLKGPK